MNIATGLIEAIWRGYLKISFSGWETPSQLPTKSLFVKYLIQQFIKLFYMNRIVFVISFFLFFIQISKGQVSFQTDKNLNVRSGLLFKHYVEFEGVSGNKIRSLFQDSYGFIWVGTIHGVLRFDGYQIEKFNYQPGSKGIAGNWINDICEDNNGNIWIGTRQGLSCYNYSSREITNYYNDPLDSISLVSNHIHSLNFIGNLLWIGTERGLSIMNINKKSFRSLTQNPFNKSINSISKSSNGYLWISTEDGVVHYNMETNDFQYYSIDILANAYGDYIWDLLEIDKDLYIATGGDGLLKLKYNHQNLRYDELMHIKLKDQNSKILTSGIQIFDLVKGENNAMWIATEMGLAMCKLTSTQEMDIQLYTNSPTNKKSIYNNTVFKLLIDKTNILWCGTGNGLSSTILDRVLIKNITFENFHLRDGVRSIYTKNGIDIWIGTDNQGMIKLNLENNNSKLYSFTNEEVWKNYIRQIYSTNGKLYVGTLGGLLENNNQIFSSDWTHTLKGFNVYDVLKTSRDEFLVGTNRGLYERTESGSFKKIHFMDMTNEPFLRCIHEDKRGNVWFGTNKNGLIVRPRNSNKVINLTDFVEAEKYLLSSSTVFCINEYPENVIWVGTDIGLYKIELQDSNGAKDICKIDVYNKDDGLVNETVQGIIPDKNGNLWISSFNSLVKFKIADQVFQNIITGLNFAESSYFKFDEDKLFFGHSNGFIMLNPNNFKDSSSLPQVFISNIKLLNENVEIGKKYNRQIVLQKSAMFTDEITLNHKNNVITFDYTALHFTEPKRNQFAYKLEGFDNQFTVVGSDIRSATYTNLDAGTYNFIVKASNSYGQWSITPCNMKITVFPPPWKTWWAIVFYIAFINGLIFIFIRLSIRQSKQQTQLKLEQQEREQFAILNNMKLKFFTDISHELRTPITLINAPVSELLNVKSLNFNVRTKIEMIKRNSSRLLHLIDELMMFRKAENGMISFEPEYWNLSAYLVEVTNNFKEVATKKGISLIFQTDYDPIWACVDIIKFEKIINNLLLNAVKYSIEGGQIIVSISTLNSDELEIDNKEIAENWIEIKVKDNGKGIQEQDLERIFERFYQSHNRDIGTGIGLSLIKSLVDMHKGHVLVKSKPNVETVFTILLPADNKDFEYNQDIKKRNEKCQLPNSLAPEELVLGENSFNKDTKSKKDKLNLPSLLLVEDNDEVLEYLEQLFSKYYNIAKTQNGIEALEHIHKLEPNVIVSDIMMPEMDGLELCQKLKNDINTCHIPVLLLTAKTDVIDNIKGVHIGADDYVTKPFSPELLLARVASLIDNRRRIIEKFNTGEGFIPQNISKNPLDEAFLSKVIALINDNLDNDEFSVEEMGQIIGMSRSNLFRKLKAIAGKTPIEFIYFIRLKRGMELLLERKLNVSEIAYEIGFRNASSFSKSFKKHFGKSPSEYLNNILKSE
jgi:signal transduction histidine kinase/ligand-binding sensor domain-containing protein/DNA-binding response OmpR family regulator